MKQKCPKCGEEMVVLPHVFEGVDVNDERLETLMKQWEELYERINQ